MFSASRRRELEGDKSGEFELVTCMSHDAHMRTILGYSIEYHPRMGPPTPEVWMGRSLANVGEQSLA